MAKFKRTKQILMPKKELIEEHEELVKDLEGAKKQHQEQKKELKELRGYADGGEVDSDDEDQTPPSHDVDDPEDDNVMIADKQKDMYSPEVQGEIKPSPWQDVARMKVREMLATPGSRLANMRDADVEAEKNKMAADWVRTTRMPSQRNQPITAEDITKAREQLDNAIAMGTMSGGIKRLPKDLPNVYNLFKKLPSSWTENIREWKQPESLPTALEKTAISQPDPTLYEKAAQFDKSITSPSLSPKPTMAPKRLPEPPASLKPGPTPMHDYQETPDEALERLIGTYESYGAFPTKRPK